MFVLLQMCPSDKWENDHDPGIEVLAIDASEEVLAKIQTEYEPRFLAACTELDALLDALELDHEISKEERGEKHDEMQTKHGLTGSLIAESTWHIVEMWDGGKPEWTPLVQMPLPPADEKDVIEIRDAVLDVCDNRKVGNTVMALTWALETVIAGSGCDPRVGDWVVDTLREAFK